MCYIGAFMHEDTPRSTDPASADGAAGGPRANDREPPAPAKENRTVLTAIVLAVVLILGWWLFSRGGAERIDLIEQFETAEKRPDASSFSIAELDLNGESKRSIAVEPAPGTRLTWRIRVPDNGWFFVSLGMRPEAWEQEGNGVYFMVGISDGRTYDELLVQHVNPFGDPTNRRWIPVYVDISAYGGEQVDLILNTRPGPPKQDTDMRHDYAIWGAPEIVVR